MKFNARVSRFKDFLDHIKGQGTSLDDEQTEITDSAIVKVTGKGLKSTVVNNGTTVVGIIRYGWQEDESAVEEGEFPIGSIDNLKDYLDRFRGSDIVEIRLEDFGSQGKRIAIERSDPKKVAKISTVHPDEVESSLPDDHPLLNEKFVYDSDSDVFTVDVNGEEEHTVKATFNPSEMAGMLKDGQLVGDRAVPVEVGRQSIKVSVGDEKIGGFESRIASEVIFDDGDEVVGQTYQFGEGLENIYPKLSGEVSLYLVDPQYPAYIVCENQEENYRAEYVNAPVEQ